MSTIHVRHIRSALENLFSGKVDLSDYDGKAEEQRQDVFLSRSLAGYVLMQLIDITSDIAGQAIVDGFDDNGIDAIHFDQSEKVFYVVQSKWMASGNGTPERGEVQKFIKGFQDLIEAKFDRFNAKVQSKKSIVLSALDDSQTKFTLVVAYTGQQPLSTHAQRDLDDL